jgi:hypothetical protein
MIYVLKIYYIKKELSSLPKTVLKISMSLHDGLQNSHNDLNNVHQNELERNSLDVDNPHCSWQIGSRLKSCAVTVAPPPWCIGGVRNSHLRSMRRLCALLGRRVAWQHEILSPMKKYMPSAKERSFLTVRMHEKPLPSSWRWRRVVATDLRPHHLLLDPSLGTPVCHLCASGVRCCSKGMVCNARTPPQCLQEGTWCP